MITTSNLDQAVEHRLREQKARYTRARRSVVAALAGADGPRSAAELHSVIEPTVPLSSLYRSLNVLEAAGVVVPHHGARGVTRYELAEWIIGHHHHLVCLECGSVEDVEIPPEYERRVEEIIGGIGRRVSFTPLGHVIEIEGRCARCS